MRIADLRPTWRQDIVELTGCDFAYYECPAVWQHDVEFGGGFRLWHHLEFERDAINRPRFTRFRNTVSRGEKRDLSASDR